MTAAERKVLPFARNVDHIESVSKQLEMLSERIEALPSGRRKGDNESMEYVQRPELDAKLETIEARMDGRLARIEDTLKTINDTLSTQRRSIWSAAAVTIGAMLAGMALIVASFDSGRDTASLVASTQTRVNEVMTRTERQQQETQKLLQDAIKAISQTGQK